MKKLTEFLEKNLQWLAIGAGALYLLWMVYSFLLTNSAWQVTVAGEPKSPGEVDEAVARIADDLKTKMEKGPKIDIKVPNFESAIDLRPKKMPDYAVAWANAQVQDPALPVVPGAAPAPGQPTVVQGDPKTNPVAGSRVVELPKV